MKKIDKKYLLKSPIRVARLSRLIAKSIDLFLVVFLSYFFYPVGVILAAVYISICDALLDAQSLGKKIMGFAVISLEDGNPCTVKQSFIRNLPITVPLLFMIVPIWGWILGTLLGIPLLLFEVYLLYKLDSGHRMGDVMADTSVMANDGEFTPVRKKFKSSWFEEGKSSVPR